MKSVRIYVIMKIYLYSADIIFSADANYRRPQQINIKRKDLNEMETKKGFSLLKLLITVICLLFIAASLAVNIVFSRSSIPHVFGRYIYIVEQNNPLGGNITEGAAVLARDARGSELSVKDIVLCYPVTSPDKVQLRSICEVIHTEENGQLVSKYTTGTALGAEPDSAITKDKILAVCTGSPISAELGRFITFTTGWKGILLELILPCVILVIFIIAKIASADKDEDEDENDFYEYDEEEAAAEASRPVSHVKGNPLFEPSQEIQPSEDFERRKMSIADHFSQKQVNPNSPYQKEKERTMQFKAQHSAESSFAARNLSSQSSTAPTADALREEMLRKTAEAERAGAFNSSSYGQHDANVITDNTGVLSKAQLAEMARNDVPKTAPLKAPAYNAPRKSSSPDINDIIEKSSTKAKKRHSEDMSVDDLIKMIESEKKKL